MLRRHASGALTKLDALAERFEYAIIRPEALRRAANFWAILRNEGLPTAADAALDVDCVLAGQAELYGSENGQSVVIATTNVAHLGRMIEAREWAAIS